ncbi:MAG: futalosine hydrolase [Lewinellaceae bacterium]|nr:futalosine hydrolase [Lewinellaceae bacterium]
MDILLVAATPFEVAPILTFLEHNFQKKGDASFEKDGVAVHPLITGVGMASTAWHLGRYLALYRPDWVLNAGVAGAFDRSFQPGEVVQVVADRFGDLGVEEADGRFTDMFELGLIAPDEPPFEQGLLRNPVAENFGFLPAVRGLTVNRVHGGATSIEAVQKKYPDIQVETMESAAFFYACLLADVPFSAIRSISNYVEPRNRAAWELGLAIERLNEVLVEMLLIISRKS